MGITTSNSGKYVPAASPGKTPPFNDSWKLRLCEAWPSVSITVSFAPSSKSNEPSVTGIIRSFGTGSGLPKISLTYPKNRLSRCPKPFRINQMGHSPWVDEDFRVRQKL